LLGGAAVIAAMVPATLGTPGPVSAATPVTVSLVGCLFSGGGFKTVPAGSTITLRIGNGYQSRGRVVDFLNAETTAVRVNGTAVANPASLWSQPTQAADGSWSTAWLDPTGITLNSGNSMTVGVSLSVAHKVPGGKDPDTGKQMFDGPGTLFSGTCTISAA
jgi:hypothetical protein